MKGTDGENAYAVRDTGQAGGEEVKVRKGKRGYLGSRLHRRIVALRFCRVTNAWIELYGHYDNFVLPSTAFLLLD